MGDSLFEMMMARSRQAASDAAYFSGAATRDGRRFSRDYLLRKQLLILYGLLELIIPTTGIIHVYCAIHAKMYN